MNKTEQLKKNKMDIVDIGKLHAQHLAGISILKLSQIWNLPYASLYRALKDLENKGRNEGVIKKDN